MSGMRGVTKGASILFGAAVCLFYCSNPTRPVSKIVNILANPEVAYDVYIDGKLCQTPVQYDAKTGQHIVLVVRDSVNLDTASSANTPGERYVFKNWADGVMEKTRNVTVVSDTTVKFDVVRQFEILASATPTSANAYIAGSGWYNDGDSAHIVAPHVDGYQLYSWTVNGLSMGNGDTLSMMVSEPAAVVAVYHRLYAFSVSTDADSGLLAIFDTTSCMLPIARTISSGRVVTLSMPSPQEKDANALVSGTDVRYTFVSWSDLETSNPRTISVVNDVSLVARMQTSYKVETTINPTSIGIVQGGGWYNKASTVVLTAPNVSGFLFDKWTINGTSAASDATLLLTVDGPKEVEATYKPAFLLTVQTLPFAGLAITIDSTQSTSPKSIPKFAGNRVVLGVPLIQERDENQLVDGTDARYTFLSWSDSAQSNTRTVVLTSDSTFTGLFKVEYKVQISSSPAGTPYPDSGGWFAKGETKKIVAQKIEGYKSVNWLVNGVSVTATDTLSITIDGPKSVVAVYSRPLYTLTIQTNPSDNLSLLVGSLSTTSPATVSQNAATTVTVTVPAIQDKDNSSYITGNDTRYVFSCWNDKDTSKTKLIKLLSDTTVTASFGVLCKVEATTSPDSIGTIAGSGWINRGDTSSFFALQIPKYTFDHWEVNSVSISVNDTLRCAITGPRKIVGVYRKQFNFSVSTSPETSIVVQIDSISLPTPCTRTVLSGDVITVQVPAGQEKDINPFVSGTDARFGFVTWSDMVTANPRNITVTQDMSLIARMAMQYKVETATSPAGIGQVNGSGWYDNGTSLSLVAPVIDRYVFDHWDVNGAKYNTQSSTTLPITEPKKVVAAYNQGILLTLTTTPDPTLALLVDGIVDTAPAKVSRLAGAAVTLSAQSPQEKDISTTVAGTDVRYIFAKWSTGDTASSRTMTLAKDTSIVAQFSRLFKVVTATNPASICIIPGNGWYKELDTAVLVAPQVANNTFDHWEVNGLITSTKDTLRCGIDNPKAVTAVYHPLYNLTLSTYPTNGLQVYINGLTSSSPKTQPFASGTSVTVSVGSPVEIDADSLVSGTDTRYTFATWNDMVTANPRNVVMSSDVSLTAQMGVKFKVETGVLPAGITTPGGSAWYDNGTSISMAAPAIAKYKFDHWEIANAFYSADSAISVTVDKPKKIVARYKPVFNITLSSSPDTGIAVLVNGKSYTTPATITLVDTATLSIQTPAQTAKDISTFVAGNDAKYSFVSWGDGNTVNPRTLFINKDTSITAVMLAKYKVQTAISPDSIGAITTDVAPDTGGYYARGTTVTFTAPYQQFYALDHWGVNGTPTGTSNSISLNITSPQTVTAVYNVLFASQPFSYRAYMTEVSILQPMDSSQTKGLNIDSLPNVLVIPPGKYFYDGFPYDMEKEGLYRFIMTNYTGQQERIVYKQSLDALLSAMSWIATPGVADLSLTNEQLDQKAMTSKLSIYCSIVTRWAMWELSGKATTREIDMLNANMSHSAFEVYRPEWNKWCYYDLEFNASFAKNGTPLSFGELACCIQNGIAYDTITLSNDAGVDIQNNTQFGIGQDITATQYNYSQLTFPMTINNVAYSNCNDLSQKMYASNE